MPVPKVSILIPTFNHSRFILETLQSVFAQQAPDVEIIVVNDGSPDDTASVLAPLIEARSIRYLEQRNGGAGRARNRALAESTGEYVSFLDDDDLLPPGKLNWQTAFLDQHPDVAVVGGTLQMIDESGALGAMAPYRADISFEALFSGNPFYSPGQTLIRGALLRRIGGMRAGVWGADDWDLWFRIAKEARIAMVDRIALLYRMHATNASRNGARMLAASCGVIEYHLRDLRIDRRREFRSKGQHNMYGTYGASLARSARQSWNAGARVSALRSLWGLRPLFRNSLNDGPLRWRIMRDLGL